MVSPAGNTQPIPPGKPGEPPRNNSRGSAKNDPVVSIRRHMVYNQNASNTTEDVATSNSTIETNIDGPTNRGSVRAVPSYKVPNNSQPPSRRQVPAKSNLRSRSKSNHITSREAPNIVVAAVGLPANYSASAATNRRKSKPAKLVRNTVRMANTIRSPVRIYRNIQNGTAAKVYSVRKSSNAIAARNSKWNTVEPPGNADTYGPNVSPKAPPGNSQEKRCNYHPTTNTNIRRRNIDSTNLWYTSRGRPYRRQNLATSTPWAGTQPWELNNSPVANVPIANNSIHSMAVLVGAKIDMVIAKTMLNWRRIPTTNGRTPHWILHNSKPSPTNVRYKTTTESVGIASGARSPNIPKNYSRVRDHNSTIVLEL